MKKISLSLLAIVFAATSVFANAPVKAKRLKAKQGTCTSCKKSTKCTSDVCTDTQSCCK